MAKVMLVDDLTFTRLMQKDILEPAGHEIIAQAQNGVQAVEKYKELMEAGNKPDVVIMDITMPEMNGLEATKKILEMDPDAKIIICSAMGQQKIIIEAIEIGVKDFIVKPIKEERLLSAIDKALRG